MIRSKALLLVTVVTTILPVTISQAAMAIVSFGGDYVSSDQNSQANLQDISGIPTASDSIRQIGGFGVALNPTIGANYSGPAFNGGAQAVKIGVNSNNGQASASIINDAGGDYISLFAQTPSGVSAGSSLSYIASFPAGNVSYGDLTGISGRTAGGVSGTLVSRFMIETTSGDYYLSNTSISGGFGGNTWSIPDLVTEQWAVFNPNPNSDWSGNFGSLTFDQTITSATEIANFGWFASRPVDAGTNSTLTIREFNVAAIPEPKTYISLLGVMALATVIFRRRLTR